MKETELAERMLEAARRGGADEADVFIQSNTKFSVDVRQGEIEKLTQANSKGLGLRVFKANRLGFACTTDFSESALNGIVERALSLAEITSADPANGLPDPKPIPNVDLDLFDPEIENTPAEKKIELAKRAEAAMFATDKRIINSEGASCSTGITRVRLLNSKGVNTQFETSDCVLVCVPISAEGEEMQMAFDYAAGRFLSDLGEPEKVGRKAAETAIRKLGARKMPTQQVPIVLERRIAASFIGGICGAVDGDAVYRQMSFLRDKKDAKIATDKLNVVDDGTKPRALGSAPCDDEGMPKQRIPIIEAGVLMNFLYDTRTARKVGVASTGSASRGYDSIPHTSPSNFYVEPGAQTPEELIAQVQNGFYVMEIMGGGVNSVTGEFSVGAAGMWIENGKLAYAVDEVTVAGKMLDILNDIEGIGSDLIFEGSTASPTLLISKMMVSGL
ncbi:MAG: TldD/PmbA family protein [bacterium]|jgi:PmbA protein